MPYEAIDCFSWYNLIDHGPKPITAATFAVAATTWVSCSSCDPVSCSCGYVVGVVFRIVVLGDFVTAGAIVIGGVVVVGSSVVAGTTVVVGATVVVATTTELEVVGVAVVLEHAVRNTSVVIVSAMSRFIGDLSRSVVGGACRSTLCPCRSRCSRNFVRSSRSCKRWWQGFLQS